jgi:hypothetical protein
MKRKASLAAYAKRCCANWLGNHCFTVWEQNATKLGGWGQILQKWNQIDGCCRVGQGKPCEYFRRCVLPTGDCPEEIREAYRRVDPRCKARPVIRHCPECNAELPRRRRICDRCRRRKGRERLRHYRQKQKVSE